jgi:hypothetical protein
MKLVTEYLAEAVKFERMADDAIDEKAKAAFRSQAAAYRDLATKRAIELGVPMSGASSGMQKKEREPE